MKLQDSAQHPKIYICHSGHDHDRIYTENLIEYLAGQGVRCKIVELNPSGLRPELEHDVEYLRAISRLARWVSSLSVRVPK